MIVKLVREASARTVFVRGFFITIALACSQGIIAEAQTVGFTPLETFARLPTYQQINLSPDGNQAVALRSLNGSYHAVMLDFQTGKSKLLMAADPENFLFNWCVFANPTRIVCSIRSYITMKAGVIGAGARWYRDGRTVATRLLAIDVSGENQIQLIPQAVSDAGRKLQWNPPNQDDVISWLPGDSKHILVQLARDDRIFPSVYKLNIYTNRLKRVQKFVAPVRRWYADETGRLRLALGRKNNNDLLAFSLESGKRVPLDLSHFDGLGDPSVLTMADDNRSAYVIANHNGSNTQGLHRVDLQTGKVLETLIEHPRFDITHYWSHSATKQILYAGYEEDGQEFTWLHEGVKSEMSKVRGLLGDPKFMDIRSVNPELSHFIVSAEGNGVNPSLYRYSVSDKSLTQLSHAQDVDVVDFRHLTYTARDGQSVPAYLALPGPKEDGPYPTIISPHGGPWSEDTGRPFFWDQYFIDRGYAVLKPNFRGSTGYGDTYAEAGFGQWGGRMQEDVIDGLDWMIAEGLADANRTCIHGASYGGYVSLVASYKTPNKFKCAVSFAGVTDLAALKERWHLFSFGRFVTARLPTGDALKENSPIENVDKIRLPLLIVHGDVDRSVMIEQAQSFVEALQTANVAHTYIEQPNGDHFFSLESHRLEYLQALESFLSEHL